MWFWGPSFFILVLLIRRGGHFFKAWHPFLMYRGQFHQRFSRVFFVQIFGAKNSNAVLWVSLFWRQIFVQKMSAKNVDEIDIRFPLLFEGVFPRNSESANTKTIILSLKQAKSVFFSLLSTVFPVFGPQIVKNSNGKTANNRVRLCLGFFKVILTTKIFC